MDDSELLIEIRPSWWNYFWHLFFFWLIIPPIVAFWKKHSKILRVYENRVALEEGILSKKYTELLIRDIRAINVSQGIFQRICHIGNILIATAGTMSYEISIKGLPDPVTLKDLIIKQGSIHS